MAKTIQIRVVTNEGEAMADEAVSIRVPGELGYLGILYNHAPLVTTMVPGTLSWRRADGTQQQAALREGLMEISRNLVTIVTAHVDAPTAPHPSRR